MYVCMYNVGTIRIFNLCNLIKLGALQLTCLIEFRNGTLRGNTKNHLLYPLKKGKSLKDTLVRAKI